MAIYKLKNPISIAVKADNIFLAKEEIIEQFINIIKFNDMVEEDTKKWFRCRHGCQMFFTVDNKKRSCPHCKCSKEQVDEVD